MARERMVTRTITEHIYTLMAFDIEKGCPTQVVFSTGVELGDNEKVLKYARKYHETETVKVITVTGHTEEETLYGMTEVDFMRYAKKLPPRTGAQEQ